AGRLLVCSVIRALLPWTTSTSWPSPAPTESSATIARPVFPNDAGRFVCSSYFTFKGSTTNSFWPLSALSLCVATTLPVMRARNIAALHLRFAIYDLRMTGPQSIRNCKSQIENDLSHFRHVRVRSWDDVDGDDFADAARGFGAGVNRRADRGDISAKGDGDEAAADLVLLDELDVRRLEGRVAGFDRRDDSFGFDQTDCFTVGHS